MILLLNCSLPVKTFRRSRERLSSKRLQHTAYAAGSTQTDAITVWSALAIRATDSVEIRADPGLARTLRRSSTSDAGRQIRSAPICGCSNCNLLINSFDRTAAGQVEICKRYKYYRLQILSTGQDRNCRCLPMTGSQGRAREFSTFKRPRHSTLSRRCHRSLAVLLRLRTRKAGCPEHDSD